MTTSQNAGLAVRLVLALLTLAIGIAVTDLTGRALTRLSDAEPTFATSLAVDT